MKIKLDYVTNSSSTGYTFYGFVLDRNDPIFSKIPEDDFYEDEKLAKHLGLPECTDFHISSWNGSVIIGKAIMYASDDGGIDQKDVDLTNLVVEANHITKAVKDTLKLSENPKLIGGVDGQT